MNTENSLTNQRVLVIGGSGKMGMEVAKLVAALGAEVIISGRSADKIKAVAASISGKVGTYPADFSIPEEAMRLMQKCAEIDHVVVTASGSGTAGSIINTSPTMAYNAFKRLWLSYNALHFSSKTVRKSGSITLLSGSSGRRPAVGYGVWGTLHGSIEALARSAALELAPIRVNVISPGGIGMSPDRQLTQHAGQPIDVARMVVAVIMNPAVTNAVIDVDGGERLGSWSQ